MNATPADSDSAIVGRSLRKRYGAVQALDGIDFTVQRGECFGFLGPNGAGKTTTMRLLHRAVHPDSGELRILGLDATTGRDDRAIKRRIGVVPQEDNLDQQLTVRENLQVFARFYGRRGPTAARRIDELLAFVGLEAKAHAQVMQLSGGMKRRALIARGLLSEPEILLLDEPTTGLDPQARHRLWEQLIELRARRTTLVLTTHYMEEAEKLCDRLVIMNQGRIVAEGSPRALIQAHVPPQVVELPLDTADQLDPRTLDGAVAYTARLADRLLLYTRDEQALMRRILERCPSCEATLRRSTLEDVFLQLTGRRLEDA